MLRIVGGEFGGRHLGAPPGTATRPTSDKVRAAIFNILGPPPADTRVLDLYAGSGAMGLEALSRGAAFAAFAEPAARAAQTVADNIALLAVGERTQLLRCPALTALTQLVARQEPGFDWIFIDPPYASGEADRALAALGSHAAALCANEVTIVVEFDRRQPPVAQTGVLFVVDERKYGDTRVAFYEAKEPTTT